MKRLPTARSQSATLSPARLRQGFTLIELLIVIAIIGIMAGLAVLGLRGLRNDLTANASELEGQIKLARSKAMTTTSAYRLVKVDKRIEAEWSERCSDTTGWQKDGTIWMELSERVSLTDTENITNNVLVCFTARGLARTNPVLTLESNKGDTAAIEVFVGGAVEVRQ